MSNVVNFDFVPDAMTRQCARCGEVKAIANFKRVRGRNSWAKNCIVCEFNARRATIEAIPNQKLFNDNAALRRKLTIAQKRLLRMKHEMHKFVDSL